VGTPSHPNDDGRAHLRVDESQPMKKTKPRPQRQRRPISEIVAQIDPEAYRRRSIELVRSVVPSGKNDGSS
jgi:hypothetical protein